MVVPVALPDSRCCVFRRASGAEIDNNASLEADMRPG